MKFRQGASVYTADGQEIGHIDRVVIDPKTKQVTNVVIRKGLLFPDDRVASINLVAEATEDHINMRGDIGDLHDLPKFEEKHYVQVADGEGGSSSLSASHYADALYGYPPAGPIAGADTGPKYTSRVEQNVPEGTVAVREGARVIAEDGKLVGRVEEILTDSGTKQATHILISQGLLTKERKLIPIFWVREFEENKIYLAAPAEILETIKPYQN